jgi:hypothetical protein
MPLIAQGVETAAQLAFLIAKGVLRCRAIGRIVIARARDVADVAISTQFGNAALARFTVITEEVASQDYHKAA